jgi:hypothetical protein
MGGRVLAGPVLTLVQQYFARPEWEYRRAAVACLARLAEGATQLFRQYLDQSILLLTAALSDASARVQFQAIQTVGRFAAIFPASIQALVDAFLPRLTALVAAPGTCDKVRGHCASAMINLVNPDACDAEVLQSHLEPLLGALVLCLQSASLEVKSPCLVLLGLVTIMKKVFQLSSSEAHVMTMLLNHIIYIFFSYQTRSLSLRCAAQVSEEAFAPYYSSFMPGIKAILRAAITPEQVTLRGKVRAMNNVH